MAKLLSNHLNELDRLKDKITEEAQEILLHIDIDKILDNTKDHVETIAKEFVNSYDDEMRQAHNMGLNYAKSVIRSISDKTKRNKERMEIQSEN